MRPLQTVKTSRELHLLKHPPLEAISRQLLVPFEDDDDRYGVYLTMPTDVSLLDDPSALLEEVRIAPQRLERADALGAFVVYGRTDRGSRAIVYIRPLAASDEIG